MIDVEQSSQPSPVPISAGEAKAVFDKSAAPGSSDDETEGYAANSVWYKATVPYALYICTDASEGAAVWRELALALYPGQPVASFTIDLNTGASQTAFTVPAGVNFYLTKAVFRSPSEDVSTADPLAIKDAGGNDWITEDLANMTAADKFTARRVTNGIFYAPADTVEIVVSSAYGSAATLEVDIFGYFTAA